MPPFECDFLDLPGRLAKEPLLPVYLVCGEEPFLRDRAVRSIVKSLSGASEYSRESYDGVEDLKSGIQGLVADLLTPSLFGESRIVLITRADDVADSCGDSIEEFVESQDGGAHLVLEAEKIDRRKKAAKVVKGAGGLVTCKRLYDQPPPWAGGSAWDNDVARWTRGEASAAGLVMSLPTAQHLIERVGPDLRGLSEEIEKISIYRKASASSPVEVAAADIDAVVGEYNEYGVFKLADSVAAGDLAAALRISSALFSQGLSRPGESGAVHDDGVIAVILTERVHSKVREILKAKSILGRGLGADAIAETLKKHKVFAKVLAKDAARFDAGRLNSMLGDLLEADLALKTGDGSPRTVFETLLVKMLGPP